MEIVKLTEAAQTKAKALLDREKASKTEAEQAGLRVAVLGGGCSGLQYSLSFRNREENDFVYEYENGLPVFVDERSAPFLTGAVMEYHDGIDQAGFEISNPNATSTCGCGKSFS